MRKLALVPLIPAAAACVAFAGPALATGSTGAIGKTKNAAVSENWAGYEVTPTKGSTEFKSVSAAWTQPKVDCSATSSSSSSQFSSYTDPFGDGYGIGGGPGFGGSGSSDGGSYAAFWVGLGGGDANAKALEQDGTQSDCTADGKAQYYAWYELVPSAPVNVKLAVHPGDKMWSQTTVDGNEVSFEIDNRTTGQNWSRTVTMTKATPDLKTAEVVAEAPSECQNGATGSCTPMTLADFGTAHFSDVSISNQNSTGGLSGQPWNTQPIELSGEAIPGKVSTDGTAFNVSYNSSGSSSSTSYPQTSGYGSSGSGYGDGGYGNSGYGDGGYGDSGYGDSGYGYGDGGYSYDPYGDNGYGYVYGW